MPDPKLLTLTLVSGGGGGPRHTVTVNSGKRRYHDLFEGPELRFFHFVCLQIQDHQVNYHVYRLEPDETFSVIDLMTLSRTKKK